MTTREQELLQEVERLSRKVKALSEAYERTVQELEQLKKEKKNTGKKGRPAVDPARRARILSLCQQGYSMREIAGKERVAASTVHKIVADASRRSRIVYVFADRENPATIIDVCSLTRKVKIVNLTDQMPSRAFGVREKPDWEDYEEFLEDRCMPGTRFGIREELARMGLDVYDPFMIVQETMGRVYGDHQYLRRMDAAWVEQYDQIMKTYQKDETARRKRLMEYMKQSEKEWKLDESEY